MARSSQFLLFRLAAQNIGRRRLRALLLGLAVMLAVGVAFASFTGGWALRGGVVTSFSRMGADIVVVPIGTLVNITSTLLTVQPTDQELDADLAERLGAIPNVGLVAPQRIVRAQVDGRTINLIAFDPTSDFTVQPWLPPGQRLALTTGGALVGERVTDSKPGDSLTICGRSLRRVLFRELRDPQRPDRGMAEDLSCPRDSDFVGRCRASSGDRCGDGNRGTPA